LVTGGIVGGTFIDRWYQNQLAAPTSPRTGIAAPPVSITTESGMKIHHVQTGFVAVKQVHRSFNGAEGQGIFAIATARAWTEWLPISAWVIEHPEGIVVVDTGEVAQASDPAYYACDPGNQFFYTSFLRLSVTPEEELHNQLTLLGIRPTDVRWVVQTHLHGDHIHGLSHYSQAEVLVSPEDYPASLGATPCLYPDWLEPTLVAFRPAEVTGFERAYPLTRDGSVLIVPTPGHTHGHQSVIVRDGSHSYLLAGDVSFDEAQLLNDGVAGIAVSQTKSRQTLAHIRAYCAAQPTVYLPSHDLDLRNRFENRIVVNISEER
jgi:glyoxylase-like metal-dependent hydrolase (beta-lactamase superfamily II)